MEVSPIARTCNCGPSPMPSIRAGEGIRVSGAGTASSPFVVSAEITTFEGSLIGVDTNTADITVLGRGLPSDPFIVSADVSMAMSQLSDWDDPAGPAVGDVPVWNGTAWEAAPPPTVPPGLVSTGDGVLGDGTAAQPIRAAVSSTSLTSTTGLAIYVDTAGNLRAERPTASAVSWDSITGKPTSFPSTWSDITGTPTVFPTTWQNVASRPSTFPSTWDTVSGKPATFPSTWASVSGKPTNLVTYAPGAPVTFHRNGNNLYYDVGSWLRVLNDSDGQYLNSRIDTLAAGANQGKANAIDSPDQAVYARGTQQAHAREAGSNRYAVWVDGSYVFGRATSSLRYKDTVSPWELDVPALLSIEPKTFHRKIDPVGVMDFGAIAEDMHEAGLTELVYYDEEHRPDGIQDHRVVWALLAALRKHDVDLAALLARVEALEPEPEPEPELPVPPVIDSVDEPEESVD